MERYFAFQSERGKIRTRITPNTDTFYAVFLSERKKNKQELKDYRPIFYCVFERKYLKGYCITACISLISRIV